MLLSRFLGFQHAVGCNHAVVNINEKKFLRLLSVIQCTLSLLQEASFTIIEVCYDRWI